MADRDRDWFKWIYEFIKQFKTLPSHKCNLLSSGFCRKHSETKIPSDISNIIFLNIINMTTKAANILTNSELEYMSCKLSKRIYKEISKIRQISSDSDIRITINPSNYRHFLVEIDIPQQNQNDDNEPYAGGTFIGELFLTKEYPMKPPKWRFLTPIYHPGVDKIGRDCLDILSSKWTPALHIRTICLSLQLMIQEPNPYDPLNNQVAHVWETNINLAHQNARQWTKKYAQIGFV